ncbi:MAG: MotA/TolQ/ExbB proton channel family protein, partial [Pirellulaceae bacterium]|nr:MotA/TolQ/ExbB proton channel family protein [Pirellulaceae bacterium]
MSRFFFVAMLLLCGLYSYGFADYFGAFSPISETPAHASSASPPATPNRSLQENQDGENETTENGENGATQEEQEPQKISYFSWIMQALNWYYVLVFLTLSFILVALFVMNMLASRQENVHPTHLIQGFETCLKEKRLKEAYELAKNDGSLLGQVLSAGMSKINQGYPRAVEAMQEVGEEENMKMEHRLSYMALIGTISPMIGLFGTVHGMINSFSVIARENGTPSPAKLAEGI